jgi:hypothetical protein
MSEDIVARLRAFLPYDVRFKPLLREAGDEIERLRAERNQLRAEIVDRALGNERPISWDLHSPARARCERYAAERGWHDLWDIVNAEERQLREGRTE